MYCPTHRKHRKPAKPAAGRSYRGTALWRKLREQAWTRDEGRCRRCGRLIGDDEPWDLGHLVPHHAGGPLELDNIAVEHRSCNRADN